MAPKASLSVLFHPKKKAKNAKNATPTPSSSNSPRTPNTNLPRQKPQVEEEEEEFKLPDTPYQEFKLMSSALNGWKYNVMKFESRKVVDISKWQEPIKLNRKDLRKEDEGSPDVVPQAVGPMLGPDGKPVIGVDGKVVMVDSEGRPIHGSNGFANGGKMKGNNARTRFHRKTKQVFLVPEETRQLRREERYPWVMEDSSPTKGEVWVGQMEEVSKSETHAFFMPAANETFKFVPAHRWYKFQKKLKHDFPTDTAKVENLYNLHQKRDPQAWLASRNGKGPSASTAAMFKAEAEGRTVSGGSPFVHNSGQSLGPGGRRLKAVDSGMERYMDDDGEEGSPRKKMEKDLGADGDMDEQLFEEDFADDEEAMEVDDNDEEAKEIEERLKREYRAANKQRDAGVDEDEEELPGMSKQEKAMQKLIRTREGNEAYESDEEENPYASEVEEEEEETAEVPTGPAIQPQPQPQAVESREGSQPPKATAGKPSTPSPSGSPSLSGHAAVAKRATSPKPPRTMVNDRVNPTVSRATSPATGSRAASPEAVGTVVSPMKRKAGDEPGTNGHAPNGTGISAPKAKKRKMPSGVPPERLKMVLIDWLKKSVNVTTKDCSRHFKEYVTDEVKKKELLDLVREVAQLKGGVLQLRDRFGDEQTN